MTTYLGVEWGALFLLEGPDGTLVSFNDSEHPDFVGILNPESSGIDSPEVREDAAERVEADGAIFGDFFAGKRPIILQGTIIASSAADRNEKVGKLMRATNALRGDATLYWTPVGGVTVQVSLRRQQPVRVTKGYVKEFQAPMVAADPRILSESVTTLSATNVSTSSVVLMPPSGRSAEAMSVPEEFSQTENNESWPSEGTWANGNNQFKSDNTYAVGTAAAGSKHPPGTSETGVQALESLAFTSAEGGGSLVGVPAGSFISGLKLEVERKASEASRFSDSQVRLLMQMVSGNIYAPRRLITTLNRSAGASWPSSDAVSTFGSSTDVWGFPGPIARDELEEIASLIRPTETQTGTPAGKTVSIDQQKLTVYYFTPLSVKIENIGDANAPFKIKVYGPIENFTLINTATGERVVYNHSISVSSYVVFDFDNKTAVAKNGEDVYKYVDFETTTPDWIVAPAGNTVIKLAGLGMTSETKLEVEFQSAWE